MINKSLIALAIFLLLSSCFSKEKGRVIASVYEKELFLSDVIDNMPANIEDSVYFVEKFMNDWIRRELMVSYAEMNLSTDILSYEKQIEDYRSSLLVYAYQKEILSQNFDTLITISEIDDYYNEYKDRFQLTKNIFKGKFIIIDKEAPNLSLLNRLYRSEGEASLENLEDYCQQFAKEYYLEYNKWQYFSIFNEKLPNPIKQEDYFLSNTKGVFFEDKQFRYYIYIRDYQIKGTESPLSLEKQRIKDVLINRKKLDYLKKLEDELYQTALVKKKIKIY